MEPISEIGSMIVALLGNVMAQRRPTINDVAARAVVSKVTVSRVLSGQTKHIRAETRERVQKIAQELGYEPSITAAALRTNRSYTITLILPDITNPIWPAVARGVQRVARAAGYAVVLANADWDENAEREYVAMARRASMDGILLSASRLTNDDLREIGIPAVILGSHSPFPDFDTVGIDTERGSAEATHYLAGLGHRRIAMIGPLATMSGQKRHRGFLAGLTASGLTEYPMYLRDAPYTREGGEQATRSLLSLPEPPTAIFASNDQIAIGALAVARELGVRVPDDLSVVGMDDIDAAAVISPPLTTLRRPQYEYGETAMRFLLERIAGSAPTEPRRHLYPCELVVRGSAAPPPSTETTKRRLYAV